MNEEKKITALHLEVLERIRPKNAERERLENEFRVIEQQIKPILKKAKIEGEIELSGSFSRDTWLSGNRDIDIFVKMPYNSKVTPEQLIKVLREGIDLPWQKKHAHHPYLFTEKDDFEIEIIPCYQIKKGMKLRSAVDRSPLHKAFINQNMPVGSTDDVRLLKQFMRGIGSYGAEIKVHGFSGYLTELLTIHFGGKFIDVLKQAKTLPGKLITFVPNLKVDLSKYEGEPIIVIDPTDDNRNVASSVQIEALNTFIAAAENYLRNPKLEYFYPKKIIVDKKKLQEMKANPIKLTIIIHKRKMQIVSDVLWGQLRRFERGLVTYLTNCDFGPIKVDSLIDGENIITAILSMENIAPEYYWHSGPPIDHEAQINFLGKYKDNNQVAYGPDIYEGRWRVLLRQDQITIKEAIEKGIKENNIAVPSHIQVSEEKSTILPKKELLEKYANNKELLAYFYQFILGTSCLVAD